MVFQLDISNNHLCFDRYGGGTYTAEGITAIADALRVNGSLTKMRYVAIRGASDARLLVHVARVRVRVLRTCVMQPSVGLLSAFPHAACAAKERSFLTYPAIDTPYCSLQPDDAPSVTLCLCALCSLDDNCLDEEAKQALRNAWRGAPSQLEL